MQSQILVSGAEAGGFEPPVRLPARQFSKLVVSATHPNFLLLAFRSNRCPSFCQLRCKGRCFSVSSQVFPSFFFLFPEIHGSLITYFSRAMNHRPSTHGYVQRARPGKILHAREELSIGLHYLCSRNNYTHGYT